MSYTAEVIIFYDAVEPYSVHVGDFDTIEEAKAAVTEHTSPHDPFNSVDGLITGEGVHLVGSIYTDKGYDRAYWWWRNG